MRYSIIRKQLLLSSVLSLTLLLFLLLVAYSDYLMCLLYTPICIYLQTYIPVSDSRHLDLRMIVLYEA